MKSGNKSLYKDLISSFVIGLFIFFVIWGIQEFKGNQKALVIGIAILSGLISTLFVFFFVTWIDEYRSWRKSVDFYVERVMIGNPFNILLKKQLEMHWQLSSVFRELAETYSNAPGGAIVISADVRYYVRILSRCLDEGQHSFLAILRGGTPPRYRPSWYFNDDDLPKIQKQDYLKLARNADIPCKRRIMIFNEEVLRQDFHDATTRNDFLRLTAGNGMELYWLPESEILRECGNSIECSSRWNQFYQYDFAIIDTMVIKHVPTTNGDLLFVSIADQVEPYKWLFRELEKWLDKDVSRQLDFKRVDLEGLKDERNVLVVAWDKWLDTNEGEEGEHV